MLVVVAIAPSHRLICSKSSSRTQDGLFRGIEGHQDEEGDDDDENDKNMLSGELNTTMCSASQQRSFSNVFRRCFRRSGIKPEFGEGVAVNGKKSCR